ncbi:D-alanyl-D-alanine carboxypeptidase family protein [Paenibacillus sp. 481]|uniref:D-alanyl-D-alanine carboxypeptidase family protein n=1 Tax=Paenibacillus sp. 481 TaxID=2835869 RepID=UPI001E401FEC|nr:D-alanyl-D-alanine carboxypeptidase family protein [Paenibacillus sp. 481]UHA74399.1 D-alanyl-D-alanine carboxypeptidase [Paenibacillus sp. 481]
MNMVKKPKYLFIVIPLSMLLFYYVFFEKDPYIDAKAAILIDAHSGEVVYSKNENVALAPASMSKMMTMYIVLEQIQNGQLQWDELVTISEHAMHLDGVSINIEVDEQLTVKDLFHAIVLSSANNAAVALAEHISNSEYQFTQLMNIKAKQLQLSEQTRFVNATGLPNEQAEESTMTALDVAKLAQHLIKSYPDIVDVTRLTSYHLADRGVTLTTTNKMLFSANRKSFFQGVDGLKTGFTNEAGYCFAGTAKQYGKRLISVVMGTSEDAKRFTETKKLFSYGFDKPNIPFF